MYVMKRMIIQFPDDAWDDSDDDSVEQIESDVQDALDDANIDYSDLRVE